MIRSFFIVLLFFLTACASDTVLHQKAARAKKYENITANEVKKDLGQPLVVRKEYPNEQWTYRLDACVLHLFFGADEKCQYSQLSCYS